MHFIKLDAYYHLATQGDREALKFLYKDFFNKAKLIAKSCISSYTNYSGNPDDFWVLIDKMFFRMLNDYDSTKGTFASYVEYVSCKKLAAEIASTLALEVSNYAYICTDIEEYFGIENLPDPDQIPMQTDIAMEKFKYVISSKNRNKTNFERIRDKILLLQYSGFSNVEICEHLNITYSQLRTHLKNIQDDRVVINLKMELK